MQEDLKTIYKTLSEMNNALSSHISKDELRDFKIEQLVVAVGTNGTGLRGKIDKLFMWKNIATGVILCLGGVWSFIQFVVPFIMTFHIGK